MKMKPTGRTTAAQWIHTALAAVVAAALAVTVLPAQDDLAQVILVPEFDLSRTIPLCSSDSD